MCACQGTNGSRHFIYTHLVCSLHSRRGQRRERPERIALSGGDVTGAAGGRCARERAASAACAACAVDCCVCSFDIPLLTGLLRRTACALYACKRIRGLYQYLGLPHCLSRCCRRTAPDGWYSVALIHKALRYHIGTAGRVRDRSRKLARLRIRARGCDHRLRGRGRRRRAFSERHLRVKRGTSGLVSLDWFGAHLLRWGPAFITCGATKPRHSGGHLSCLPWPNAMCMAAPNA